VLLKPRLDSTRYREYRLWRNDPRIRFEGVITRRSCRLFTVWHRRRTRHRPGRHPAPARGLRGRPDLQAPSQSPPLRRQLAANPTTCLSGTTLPECSKDWRADEAEEFSSAPWMWRAKSSTIHSECCRTPPHPPEIATGAEVGPLLSEARRPTPPLPPDYWRAGPDRARSVRGRDRPLRPDTPLRPTRSPPTVPLHESLLGELPHDGRAFALFKAGRYSEAGRRIPRRGGPARPIPAYAVKRSWPKHERAKQRPPDDLRNDRTLRPRQGSTPLLRSRLGASASKVRVGEHKWAHDDRRVIARCPRIPPARTSPPIWPTQTPRVDIRQHEARWSGRSAAQDYGIYFHLSAARRLVFSRPACRVGYQGLAALEGNAAIRVSSRI